MFGVVTLEGVRLCSRARGDDSSVLCVYGVCFGFVRFDVFYKTSTTDKFGAGGVTKTTVFYGKGRRAGGGGHRVGVLE